MPNPTISPAVLGAGPYTISNSKGAIVDVTLSNGLGETAEFTVTYPSAAAAVQVTLIKGGTPLDLLPAPASQPFAGRTVETSTVASGTDTILTCDITVASGASPGEAWTVKIGGLAGGTCVFALIDLVAVTRVMCDPAAGFVMSGPSLSGTTTKEKSTITLTGTLATTGPTVVGAPAPAASYKFTYSGDIAITAFPLCGPQIQTFDAPGVYGSKTISISEQAWYDGSCPDTPGFLENTSAAQSLTTEPRRQYLLLVLDRSGSMLGTKWETAKTAARILTNLFVALRTGIADDRVGIIVFEDSSCTWHPAPIDPLIGPGLALGTIGAADGAVCGLNLGEAGSCTPIGDALYKAMQLLNGLSFTGDPWCTIILLTDGYENSGTIRVDPNTPVYGGFVPRDFSAARGDFPNVNSRLAVYAVGIGGTVQDDVLDHLSLPDWLAGQESHYRNITDVSELKEAIGQMVSLSQEAQPIAFVAGPPWTPRTFLLEAKANRFAVAVEWSNAADTIELEWRQQGSGGAFSAVAPTLKQCPDHGLAWVDLASQFGGEANVPATEWHVVHRSGGVAQNIPDDNLLGFVDLYVKADCRFDRVQYRTGDPMVITARLRAGDKPILGASVAVELARPGESLGTFLGTYGTKYSAIQPTGARGPDPAAPKLAMLLTLLHQNEMEALPVVKPPSIFVDGSHELLDDGAHSDGAADDGNYANVFANTDKEGVYTWRFLVEGKLEDGSAFSRVITVSRWVGVNVDPWTSAVWVTFGLPAPRGFQAARIWVQPADKALEKLGPFRASDLAFTTTVGRFLTADEAGAVGDGVVFAQADGAATVSHYDGRYSRVIQYRKGLVPIVTVTAQGKPFMPVVVAPGCLGRAAMLVRRILQWIMRLLGR